MNPQRYDSQQPKRTAENAKPDPREDWREAEARREAEMAARSVMHPESYDREWRYYHGAWGG
jgi:hypothetical protein